MITRLAGTYIGDFLLILNKKINAKNIPEYHLILSHRGEQILYRVFETEKAAYASYKKTEKTARKYRIGH